MLMSRFARPLKTVTPAAPPAMFPQLKVIHPDEPTSDAEPTSPGPTSLGPTSLGGLVATDELLEELARKSLELESATPQKILEWTAERFAPRFTMATAFGPEGMILIHMLAEIAPNTPIFNLDTGYQFAETLELREEVKRRYGIAVEMKQPATSVEEYERANGGPIYRTNPD